MNRCPYCGRNGVIKKEFVDLLQGYSEMDYWYECEKCGSKTKKIYMLDIEQWNRNHEKILESKLKQLEDEWNNGKIKRNEKYFNVTITREEYERLKGELYE